MLLRIIEQHMRIHHGQRTDNHQGSRRVVVRIPKLPVGVAHDVPNQMQRRIVDLQPIDDQILSKARRGKHHRDLADFNSSAWGRPRRVADDDAFGHQTRIARENAQAQRPFHTNRPVCVGREYF
jgi:hypothetical protein